MWSTEGIWELDMNEIKWKSILRPNNLTLIKPLSMTNYLDENGEQVTSGVRRSMEITWRK